VLDKEKLIVDLKNAISGDSFKYVGDFMGKPRMSSRDRWAKRDCVLRYFSIKDNVTRQAKGFKLGDAFIVKFTIKTPDSWSKKKKELMLGTKHQSKPDNSNLLKAIEDIMLDNDSQVWFTISTKFWGNETSVEIINLNMGGNL
jgi:Holliday junction resolvase RusA-like endonuclease